MGEEQRLCVDTNCQRKSITVPVTVVLGLVAQFQGEANGALKPAPDELFSRQNAEICGWGTCTSVRTGSPFGKLPDAAVKVVGVHSTMRRLKFARGGKEESRFAATTALYFRLGDRRTGGRRGRAFEVIVGAYLTQNTAWTNVEKALANLRSARLLSVKGLRRVPLRELERLIRPVRIFSSESQAAENFHQISGSAVRRLSATIVFAAYGRASGRTSQLNGVGPETADSILLYAGNHPVFVVDAYTRRILARHGILPGRSDYEEVRELFERALSPLAESVAGSHAKLRIKIWRPAFPVPRILRRR